MIFTWNDSLSVGIPEIDDQHRKLIRMIGDFYEIMKEGRSKDVILQTVNNLAAYAKEHFATEERWFTCYEYPGMDSHIEQHLAIAKQIKNFQNMIEAGQVGVGIKVSLFLSDWIRTHLSEDDQKYARYFQEQGIVSLPTLLTSNCA